MCQKKKRERKKKKKNMEKKRKGKKEKKEKKKRVEKRKERERKKMEKKEKETCQKESKLNINKTFVLTANLNSEVGKIFIEDYLPTHKSHKLFTILEKFIESKLFQTMNINIHMPISSNKTENF